MARIICECLCGLQALSPSQQAKSPALPIRPTIKADSGLVEHVTHALHPEVPVDFPLIIRICDLAVGNLDDMHDAVSLLVATLSEQTLKDSDQRKIAQDYLKALTLLNEMVYDDNVTEFLRQMPEWRDTLGRLMLFRDGELGRDADVCIRMLASELLKKTPAIGAVAEATKDDVNAGSRILAASAVGAGAAIGTVAQATALGVTYTWGGYQGMVGLVFLASGGAAAVPVATGFAAAVGLGAATLGLGVAAGAYLHAGNPASKDACESENQVSSADDDDDGAAISLTEDAVRQ